MNCNDTRGETPRGTAIEARLPGCIVVLCALVVTGCSTILPPTHEVTLAYKPQANVRRIERADAVRVAVKVTDVRKEWWDLVGYNYHNTRTERPIESYYCTNDVPEMFRTAIETELTNRGFVAGDGQAVVDVEFTRFFWTNRGYKTAYTGPTAEGGMNVTVRKTDGTVVYTKKFFQTSTLPVEDTPRLEVSMATVTWPLEQVMVDVVGKLVNDPEFTKALFVASAK